MSAKQEIILSRLSYCLIAALISILATTAIVRWQIQPFMLAVMTLFLIVVLQTWRLIIQMKNQKYARLALKQRIRKAIRQSDAIRTLDLSLPPETRSERQKRVQAITDQISNSY